MKTLYSLFIGVSFFSTSFAMQPSYLQLLPTDIATEQLTRLITAAPTREEAINQINTLSKVPKFSASPLFNDAKGTALLLDVLYTRFHLPQGPIIRPEELAARITTPGAQEWLTKIRPQEEELFKAVQAEDLSKVKKLLAQGVNPSARQDVLYRTALMNAINRNYLDIAQELLNKGADVNAQDIKGETALMRAINSGNASATKLLLDKGANPHIRDYNKKTALDHIQNILPVIPDYNPEVIKAIQEAEKRTSK